MKSVYYDRRGNSIDDTLKWGQLFNDLEYKRVARTELVDGTLISTVWLGLDHGWGQGPPLIFETMVFADGDDLDKDCERYSTEAEALAGHTRMVEKWKKRRLKEA